MDAVGFLAAMAAIWKLMDLIKYVKAKDVNGAVTLLLTYVLAVAAVLLFAEAELAQTWEVPGVDVALSTLDFASKLIVGLVLASSASVAFDLKKAIDRSDSAVTPSLVSGSHPNEGH